MAAGPGIPPRATARRGARRSARNYPHWSRATAGLDLVDVTFSGATTANVLPDANGAPPQVDALDGSETLVTVTIGGNDVGYVPLLTAAGLPAGPCGCRSGRSHRERCDRAARDRALDDGRRIAA